MSGIIQGCALSLLLVSLVHLQISFAALDQAEEDKAVAFLKDYNKETARRDWDAIQASWVYATNLTDHNSRLKTNASLEFSAFLKVKRQEASKFDVSKLSEDTARQIRFITATAAPSDQGDLKKLSELEGKLDKLYSSATVKDNDGRDLALDPDLYRILRSSRDYERLKFVWKGWRDSTGPKMRPLYKEFVGLSNKGAEENNWEDLGAWWRSWYEVDDLQEIVEGLYQSLKPLYQELHAYVRFKLRDTYPQISKDGPIPAHLFGNMWAQSWQGIYDLVEPYKNKSSLDVTKTMVAKKMTAEDMVRLAESFFTSIGLEPLPKQFYTKSLIEKPDDGRDVVCHASAWDFKISKDGERDVRIKQCTDITHDDLVTTHHELGHIQYYLQYWDLPVEYRTGANPGFHEAMGDTLSLSVNTPQHLEKIGLLQSYVNDEEADVNALMKMALRKVAFLPFGFLIDQWRWRVFSGEITSANYNAKWWELRTKYQGIVPPVERSEEDFDPGAKYHIPGNTPYIRYFCSFVLQFQFHKAACEAANVKGPLHQCSIYQSKEAGKKIGDMLKLGKSKPWPEALEKLTGSRKMDVGPLKEYFDPLYKWMKKQRQEKGYPMGWDEYVTAAPTSSVGTLAPVLLAVIGAAFAGVARMFQL